MDSHKSNAGHNTANDAATNNEWQLHLPGGDTTCSAETPYAFYTRQTGTDKLLIYFQGGGASIADSASSSYSEEKSQQSFDPSVAIPGNSLTHSKSFWDHDNPAELDGIFNLADERNPLVDYNMVFIPYCTGDVHIGDGAYNGIHHRGYINAATVLNWTYANIPDPKNVVVMGSSAGGIGAPLHVGAIARNYADAEKISILSDSSGCYRVSVTEALQNWSAIGVMQNEFGDRSPSPEELNFDTATIVNGARYPHIAFAQFNANRDPAQQEAVRRISGQELVAADLLAANHSDIHAIVENFHTYTVDDEYHVILTKNLFYEESVGRINFYEWVANFIDGVDIPNIAP